MAHAPADARIHARLSQHLQALVHAGLARIMDASHTTGGGAFTGLRVDFQLLYTDLYVPILSPDFIASAACCRQLEAAVELERAGKLVIVPVLAREVDLGATSLADHTPVGEGLRPLDLAANLDTTLGTIARSVRLAIRPEFSEPDGDLELAPGHDRRLASGPPRRLLCLLAQPRDCELSLGVEHRAIRAALRDGPIHAEFVPATTFDDVQRELLRRDYDMLHFSGHHDANDGLVFGDAVGWSRPVTAEAFVELVRLYPSVRTLVLNTCNSLEIARGCASSFDYVIGMGGSIVDQQATRFSEFFYSALAHERDVPHAFRQGRCNEKASPGARARAHLLGRAVATAC